MDSSGAAGRGASGGGASGGPSAIGGAGGNGGASGTNGTSGTGGITGIGATSGAGGGPDGGYLIDAATDTTEGGLDVIDAGWTDSVGPYTPTPMIVSASCAGGRTVLPDDVIESTQIVSAAGSEPVVLRLASAQLPAGVRDAVSLGSPQPGAAELLVATGERLVRFHGLDRPFETFDLPSPFSGFASSRDVDGRVYFFGTGGVYYLMPDGTRVLILPIAVVTEMTLAPWNQGALIRNGSLYGLDIGIDAAGRYPTLRAYSPEEPLGIHLLTFGSDGRSLLGVAGTVAHLSRLEGRITYDSALDITIPPGVLASAINQRGDWWLADNTSVLLFPRVPSASGPPTFASPYRINIDGLGGHIVKLVWGGVNDDILWVLTDSGKLYPIQTKISAAFCVSAP